MLSIEFLLTSLVIVLIPGTGVIYTVSSGLFDGKGAAASAAIGCTLGILPHLAASIFGLSALLHTSALAFQFVKYGGVGYLLYLAYLTWKESGSLSIENNASSSNLWKIAFRGVLINILNPKLSIFFLAFLPLFISAENPRPFTQMLTLSVTFMLITLIIFLGYGMAANAARDCLLNSPKALNWMRKSFACLFAALGIKLAFAER